MESDLAVEDETHFRVLKMLCHEQGIVLDEGNGEANKRYCG